MKLCQSIVNHIHIHTHTHTHPHSHIRAHVCSACLAFSVASNRILHGEKWASFSRFRFVHYSLSLVLFVEKWRASREKDVLLTLFQFNLKLCGFPFPACTRQFNWKSAGYTRRMPLFQHCPGELSICGKFIGNIARLPSSKPHYSWLLVKICDVTLKRRGEKISQVCGHW